MSKTICHTTGDLSDIRLIPSSRKSFTATRTAADIMPGKTSYSQGNKVTGSATAGATADAIATAADIGGGKIRLCERR